jgi:putative ABC transport system permease protein
MFYFALQMLFRDRIKFVTLILGLTFSVLLISQQSSIFCGLLRRFYTNITNANVPIWVMDPSIRFIDDVKPLLDTDLSRVRSVDGVAWAEPFMQKLTQVKLNTGASENVYLMGVDAHSLVGAPSKVIEGDIRLLNTPEGVAVDKMGLKKLGGAKLGDTFEINDLRARIVAVVDAPEGFQNLPYVITTYDQAKLYSPPVRKQLSFIIAAPAKGLTVEEACQKITAETGLLALSQEQFIDRTLDYFLKNTGIPINFGVTVLLGVIVGAAIAAQTFYTFTIENLRQFATMKAMGASNQMLVQMVLLQSAVVGFIGLGLGLGWMTVFGSVVPKISALSFYTPWFVLLISLVAVTGVCMFSSLFSIFRMMKVDPAIVFRG